jgi:preprotein translocase subunit SecG
MMSIAFIAISVVILILSVVLIGLILAQKKDAAGFTSGMGGMTSGTIDTSYWGKNKKNSLEGKLELLTKIVAALWFVLILASNFVK